MALATFLKINPADSVVVCLQPKKKGEVIDIDGKQVVLNQDTPAGHKVLINDVKEGDNIIKYGYPIGHARQDMKAGDWVNENNLKTNLSGTLEYAYQPVDAKSDINHIKDEKRTFKGYVRKNGDVGVRNEIWIVPTVGCVNGIAERMAQKLREETGCKNIDSIWTWHHNYGCSQLSEDHENTRKVLRDICLHPNAGGVLVLSLGCENNQPEDFMAMLGDYDKDRIKLLVTQRVEGDEMEAGMEILRDLYRKASQDKRQDVSVSKLRVGLKCGGSDGFSGITANPLVGEFSDWLVAQGGTSVLTEVPEMFGA
jgi:altronate hydrolase